MNYFKFAFWNTDQLRLRTGYRIVIEYLFKYLFSFGLGFILVSFVPGIKLDANIPFSLLTIYGITIRLFPYVFSVWLTGFLFDKRSFADFGFHFSIPWRNYFLFGLALGSFLMTFIFVVEYSFRWITISSTFYSNHPGQSFIVPFLVLTLVFVCVGVGEEIFSRGYLIKNFAEGFNFKWMKSDNSLILAWILSSVIFGLLHINNPDATIISTVNIVIGGFIFGIGYVVTGELAIPVGLHISWNLFQGNVFGFPVSGLKLPAAIVTIFKTNQSGPLIWTGGDFGPEAGFIGLTAMILGIFLTFAWLQFTGRNIKLKTSLAFFTKKESPPFPNEVNY